MLCIVTYLKEMPLSSCLCLQVLDERDEEAGGRGAIRLLMISLSCALWKKIKNIKGSESFIQTQQLEVPVSCLGFQLYASWNNQIYFLLMNNQEWHVFFFHNDYVPLYKTNEQTKQKKTPQQPIKKTRQKMNTTLNNHPRTPFTHLNKQYTKHISDLGFLTGCFQKGQRKQNTLQLMLQQLQPRANWLLNREKTQVCCLLIVHFVHSKYFSCLKNPLHCAL